MTHSEIESIVALWQKRLGLGHWQIIFMWETEPEPCEDGEALAEVNAQDLPYNRTHIRFAHAIADRPRESVGSLPGRSMDEVVVHELLHLAQRDCDRAALDLDDGMLQQDVAAIRSTAYHEARERFVDDLSRALVAAFED